MNLALLIPFFPLFSFILLSFFGRRIGRLSPIVGIVTTFLSLLISIFILVAPATQGGGGAVWRWLTLGDISISFGFEITPLGGMMLFVVSLVSFLVHVYSVGYMHGDARIHVFFQYLGLFTFAMLALVISPNLLQIYLFWELVGVASFLLIGFYYYKPEAKAAARKAFLVTRLGDIGLFIAMILLFLYTSSFDLGTIFKAVSDGTIPQEMITLTAILIFIGAMGKSGQFPLHIWLPDAMEGPTPVSALIHAATMVAAGVYLVAATYPLFAASQTALFLVALVGGFTAIFAASIGLAQNDMKRVLAFSTVSQLGYMMLALGLGGYIAGLFHLFTHAFFKALLFLGAGSVIHMVHTQNIKEMGGLARKMPITAGLFLVGGLALVGIPPFSGFFSKELIIAAAYEKNLFFFLLAVATAFFTAFYMSRLFILVFMGEKRSQEGAAISEKRGTHHAEPASGGKSGFHEAPMVMLLPMFLLALAALFAGLVETPWGGFFGAWLTGAGSPASLHVEEFHAPIWVAILTVALSLFGILLAYLIYGKGALSPVAKGAPALVRLVSNRYYVDELYQSILYKPFQRLAEWLDLFDRYVMNGLVSLVVKLTVGIGPIHARIQNGQVQRYGTILFLGLTILLFAFNLISKGARG